MRNGGLRRRKPSGFAGHLSSTKRSSTVALNYPMMKALCDRLKPGSRIASMGYPDLLAPVVAFETILGDRFDDLKYRDDSNSICQRHGIRPLRKIPDAKSFFGLLEANLDVFDIVQERGDEIICDLNHEMMIAPGVYDFVLDVGTLEHCFNIAQAVFNMAGLLKEGGVIFHENPFLMGNHGFYSMNPTWYADFYGQDGFRLISCVLITKNRIGDVPHTGRFIFTDDEATCFAIAERTKILPLTFPTQTK